MADDRRSHDSDERSAGFDVWLPAATAVAAALFMLTAAHAETAAPRPIYDSARFEAAEVAREAAEAAAVEATAAFTAAERHRVEVQVVALPALETALVEADPAAGQTAIAASAEPTRAGGWLRIAAPLAIAALLAAALAGLGRLWHRTEPSLA